MKPPVHMFGAVWLLTLITLIFAFAMSPALGHDIYTRLTMGTMCARCGGNDCAPVKAEPTNTPRRGYWLPASGEFVPVEMARQSPDERFHRCAYPPNLQWRGRGAGQGPEGWIEIGTAATRCFWAPALGF